MELTSCLYECSVMHQRLVPKPHGFRYWIFMFYLDLDEVDALAKRIALFSRNRFNLYSFHDSDHLESEPGQLKRRVREYLAGQSIELPADAKIRLLTLPRVLGYIFNPVSFYFCSDADNVPICAVAEVGNTFGEQKPFVLREPENGNCFRLITPKHFYVSPFSELTLDFDFKLTVPDRALRIHIDEREGEKRLLLSALTGTRAALDSFHLSWFTIKYPLVTLQVILLIHWHALLLWFKRIPWHRKEANVSLQRDVLRPHASLAGKVP